jgi:glycine/D-amino acid oxidase-like deaminating enzyme
LWPYKFVLGLLKILLSTGKVNLQTNTAVLSVKPDEERGFAIETERGIVYAKRVVHASNGYVSGLLPEYERNIIPCKGICSHIEVPKQNRSAAPLFINSYCNRTDDNTNSYLIPRLDGSIIVGGAGQTFWPFRDQWYRNVDDSVLIDAAKDYYGDYMQRTYHGWENTGAQVSHIWTGVMGYSFDSNPHIGSVPSKPGQFILAGFNGHGMPVIWLGAKGLAKMILADCMGETLPFSETGIPRLFQTSQFRIDRARNNKEEDGDIFGTGQIFLPAMPICGKHGMMTKM